MSSRRVQASSTASRRALELESEAFPFPEPLELFDRVMHCQKAFSMAHQRTSQVLSNKFRSIMSILIIAVDWDIDWEEVCLARYS